ncbi:flagellar protein FlaG [Bacillus sp. JJ1533]|uniref:flagellar protein FlaG n=1 Tax=Bacillus sp. JJ1533 TaxID=3122959 RepID=UPI0030000AF9
MVIKDISFDSSVFKNADISSRNNELIIDHIQPKEDKHVEENILVSKEKLEDVVDVMNDFLSPTTTALKFELHEELQKYYVKIIDTNSNEVVREIPSKKLLDIYASMTNYLGLFFDNKA